MEKLIPKLRFPEFKGEWEEKQLGNITTWASGGTPPKDIDSYWNGNISWISASSMRGIEYSNSELKITNEGLKKGSKLAPKGSLLILVRGSMLFNTIPIGIVMQDVAFNQDVKSIIVDGTTTSKYILYWFISYESKILNMVTGTGIGAGKLDLMDLKALGISLPTLPEQQKIATFLTSVDEKLQALKNKKGLLEQYKKGVMQKIFSQEFRFKPARPSGGDENGNDFPEWEEKSLGDCLDYEQPTNYLVASTEYNDKFQTPVLTAGKTFILGYTDEINGIYKDNLPVIIFDDFTTATQFVEFPFKAKSSAMKILKAKEQINIKFVFEAMKMMKYEVGGHERHWISKFTYIEMQLPSLNEQTHIANFLNSIDDKINHCGEQIAKMEVWKKGLLQEMFC